MATLPPNIVYGVVTGRLVTPGPDTDGDTIPEPIPLEGRVVFTPSVNVITEAAGNPGSGTTIPLQKESVELEDGQFAIKLVATDYGNPQGWTWMVSFELIANPGIELEPFHMTVPGNVITDLAHVQPIQESSGVFIIAAQGMPRGGTTGQYVVKLSDADYHFGFVTGGTGDGGGDTGPVLVESIQDASELGKDLLQTLNPSTARGLIGAGTSSLALGTTGTTAKPGNWKPAAADITDSGAAGRTVIQTATNAEIRTLIGPTTVDELVGAQTPGKDLLKASTQAAARTAIGAGTGSSSLVLGTTATTAKAGNYVPAWADVTGKPTFHNVATSGDYNALVNKPTTVITHTHDDLVARIEALEARPQIFYVETETSAIPAEARPQDYIVYRSSSTTPAVTSLKSYRMAGVPDGTALTTSIVGSGDTALDAVVAGATIQVNGTGLREIHNPNSGVAVTWRWTTGLPTQDFSFDIGFRPSGLPTATGTILLMGGVLSLTMSATGLVSLLNSAGTFVTQSPAMSITAGIYRLKAWRSGSTAGTLTNIKFYAPDGTPFWEPTARDLGVAAPTSFIMGRTGTAGGGQYWSNLRLHNVGAELTA